MSFEAWIIATGVLVGVSCGLIGTFLVLRRMAMLADAISHTVLLGIVGAFLVTGSLDGIPMFIGAAVSGLLTAFLVQLLHSKGVQSDAAIGVVFTSLFAVGVILLSVYGANVHLDIEHSLMGEIAFVPWNTITVFGVDIGPKAFWMLASVLVLNVLLISVCYKEFKIASFDPQMALALGIPVLLIHYVQMGMLSLTTVASFDSVGAVLVVAMLIVPPAAAHLLTDRLLYMLILSAVIGGLSAVMGYFFATWLNVSISGAMAAMTGVCYTGALLFSPANGVMAKKLRTLNMRKERAG
ncbi:manganese ABC transporter permease MntD [Bacillus inaquosorum]|uniref:manganese ABC transporter permease MntD n=1 Tax=Bacillus inaquosorum TaxID=483913 RepID=UPI00228002A4|nr:manganese ABC transporter permease MntD [Bacillus inaquosorum]MCY7748783.1 manganese ABC transporter permease MntD [Bacillus inaquosorum]MCY7907778.1 manganese ABC transporter permease MntD [Bacillus inaquosorum]MCY8185044.1 manganese ABC transporter permease MntD [Bacillus inaquosorum]MCY8501762.1 manganese ABC transporter permease MntD [Bacillus inaquosorum]MCY8860154.1 manganese ABC transporter permease MntD [Bacillus inaquosorum]